MARRARFVLNIRPDCRSFSKQDVPNAHLQAASHQISRRCHRALERRVAVEHGHVGAKPRVGQGAETDVTGIQAEQPRTVAGELIGRIVEVDRAGLDSRNGAGAYVPAQNGRIGNLIAPNCTGSQLGGRDAARLQCFVADSSRLDTLCRLCRGPLAALMA